MTAFPGSNTAVIGHVDLLAGLGLHIGVDVRLADHGGGEFDAVDHESGLVTGDEIDDDLVLAEHLDGVFHGLHRLDRLGPIDAVGSGDRRRQTEDDQCQSARDHQAGDEQSSIETAFRTWLDVGRLDVELMLDRSVVYFEVVDGDVVLIAHPSMMPAASARCAGGSVSTL